MRAITLGVAALALGTAFTAAPALAQGRQSAPSWSNAGPWGAPLSPGGIAASGVSFGGPGPGYIGPPASGFGAPQTRVTRVHGRTLYASVSPPTASFSTTNPWGAPLSPGGISSSGASFGGPSAGYIGPQNPGPAPKLTYSTLGPRGAPLSPGGISASGVSFGGPGYNGPY